MKLEEHKKLPGRSRGINRRVRMAVWTLGGLGLAATLAVLVIHFRPGGSSPPQADSAGVEQPVASSDAQRSSEPAPALSQTENPKTGAPAAQTARTEVTPQEPTPESRELVNSLVNLQTEN